MALIYGDNLDHHKPYANAKPNASPPDPGYWTAADASADYLAGTADADRIDGGLLNDTLIGGGGDDYLYGGSGNNVLSGGDGDDYLAVESGNSILSGDDGNDWIYLGSGGTHTVSGGAGYDSLHAEYLFAGETTLAGGEGDDAYYIYAMTVATIVELAEEGNDQIQLYFTRSGSYYVPLNVEYVFMMHVEPMPSSIKIYGNEQYNYISGNTSDDFIDGGGGDDDLNGEGGNNTLLGGDGNDSISADDGNNVMEGGAGNDSLHSGSGDDVMRGGDGDDYLEAGDGVDTLDGGAGNDHIFAGGGNDRLDGGDGDDTLNGGAGDDTLNGGKGNDLLYGGAGDNAINGNVGADTVFLGAADDGKNSASGGEGNDYFVVEAGFSGQATLSGGTGDDTYALDAHSNVAIVEIAGEGDDLVRLSFSQADSFTMAANVEKLTMVDGEKVLTGLSIDGNALDNRIDGSTRDRYLIDGGGGNDTIIGGVGNNTLRGGDGDDDLSSNSAQGNDQMDGGAGDDRISGGGGDDVIHGGAGSDNLQGDAGNNQVYGDAGDDFLLAFGGTDYLDGGDGNDMMFGTDSNFFGPPGKVTMVGGKGNDNYRDFLPDLDTALELSDEGYDWLMLHESGAGAFTLPDNIEGLSAPWSGSQYTRLTGNAGDNQIEGASGIADVIDGGAGNDSIDGHGGADTLLGGDGDDLILTSDYYDHSVRLPWEVDGGAGEDALYVYYKQSQLTSTKKLDDGWRLLSFGDDTVRVRNVEWLHFDDGEIALDSSGPDTGVLRFHGINWQELPDGSYSGTGSFSVGPVDVVGTAIITKSGQIMLAGKISATAGATTYSFNTGAIVVDRATGIGDLSGTSATIAGLTVTPRNIHFSGADAAIVLGLTLPAEAGGFKLDADGSVSLLLQNDVFSLRADGQGTVRLPDIDARLYGVLDVKTSQVTLAFDSAQNAFGLTGKFSIDPAGPLPNLTMELRGNGLLIQDGKVAALDTQFTVDKFAVRGIGVEDTLVALKLGGENDSLGGHTKVSLPFFRGGTTIEAAIGFALDPPQLDSVDITASLATPIPIGATPMFITSLGGGIANIAAASSTPVLFKGSVGLSVGAIRSPVEFMLRGEIDVNHGSGELTGHVISDSLLQLSGHADFDWRAGTLSYTGTASILDGVASGSLALNANLNLDIRGGGSAQIKFLGYSGSGQYTLNFSNDNNSGNDYVSVWTTLSMSLLGGDSTLQWGANYYFDGKVTPLGQSVVPLYKSWIIDAGGQDLLIQAHWSSVTTAAVQTRLVIYDDLAKTVVRQVVQEADYAAQGIAVVSALGGANDKFVYVARTSAGVYDLELVDASKLGTVSYSASTTLTPLSLNLLAASVNDSVLALGYATSSATGQIQFYADTDGSGYDGRLLGVAAADASGVASLALDQLAPGSYWIYGVLSDGQRIPAMAYATTPVAVSGAADVSVSISNAALVGLGQGVDVSLQIVNHGTAAAHGLDLAVLLPAGLRVLTSSRTADRSDGQGLHYLFDMLLPGQTVTLTWRADGAAGSYLLQASVGGSGYDKDLVDNQAISSVQIAVGQGSAGDDNLSGTAKDDILSGGAGNDMLSGGAGDDTLHGGDGGDILNGGPGNDKLDGGAGIDLADYRGASAGVVVDLGRSVSSGADGNDVLTSIEGVLGSAFGDTLTGGAGDDLLTGGGGDDGLTGGEGSDTADYHSASGAVSVNLAQGVASGADGSDTLAGIENVIGSAFADTLVGGRGGGTLSGLGGDDRLSAGANGGTLLGGDGDDVLESLSGTSNTLDGGAGDDVITGGNGGDRLIGGAGNDTLDGGVNNKQYGTTYNTAVYSGAFASYQIEQHDGYFTVSSVAEGVDTLRNIDILSFADRPDLYLPREFVEGKDHTAPTFSSYLFKTKIKGAENLSLTFSEIVQAGSGTISIKDVSGKVIESFDVASSTRLSWQYSGLSIDPSADLAAGALYTVNFSDGVVKDLAGNNFEGALSASFKTMPATASTITEVVPLKLPATAVATMFTAGDLNQAASWNTAANRGQAVALTFSFGDTRPADGASYTSDEARAWSIAQEATVRQVLSAYAQVAGVTFTETANPAQADLGFYLYYREMDNVAGYAIPPVGGGQKGNQAGDVFLNTSAFAADGANAYLLYHEIGHALGLAHPYDGNNGTPTIESLGIGGNRIYSVVDERLTDKPYYFGPNGWEQIFNPSGPMILDIAALQTLYGANAQTNNGDTTYRFDVNPNFYRTIWDGGGHDTIDVSNQSNASLISLEAGNYSTIGLRDPFAGIAASVIEAATAQIDPIYFNDGSNSLTIAFGVVIEDAIGSAAADILIGNAADNKLSGGGGNDRLRGSAGNDVLEGGNGLDLAIYGGARSNYTVARTASGGGTVTDNVATEGRDVLTGVERLAFSDSAYALDIDGVAGQAYRIYQAAFNRTPDLPGLGYWIQAMDSGQTLTQVAAGFVSSSEFQLQYGAGATHEQLLTRFYQNILHRAPDPAGYDYWLDILVTQAATVPQVLAFLSESQENVDALAAIIGNGFAYTPYGV